MVHLVRALDEVGFDSLDSQLHFDHDSLPVHDVDKNILGDIIESVPHSHYLEDVRIFFTYIHQTLVSLDDLFFLGMALAPEQISDVEGNQTRPLIFMLIIVPKCLSDCDEQPMDQSIEIGNQVNLGVIPKSGIEQTYFGFEIREVANFLEGFVFGHPSLEF